MSILDDIAKVEGNVLIVVGDMHDYSTIDFVNELIPKLKEMKKLDYLLLENAFNYYLPNRKDILKRIKKEDWMIGEDHYKFGLDHNLPIYGTDLPPNDKGLTDTNLEKSFSKRETRMLEVARGVLNKGSCLMVVGDTHLRELVTKELGKASPIYTHFKNNKKVFIIRAPIKDREIDVDREPDKTYTRDEFN